MKPYTSTFIPNIHFQLNICKSIEHNPSCENNYTIAKEVVTVRGSLNFILGVKIYILDREDS
jgi:hypothetical protein